jgi:hypothetical protein
MATINDTGLPTLLDQVKRTAPGGAIDRIIEQLTKKNPILEDMVWQEGNLPTGHRFTSRTSLPSVGWRRLNEGMGRAPRIRSTRPVVSSRRCPWSTLRSRS